MYNYSLIMYFLFKLYYKVINSNICSDELDDSFYFTNKLNKFKTLNIPGFKNGNDIKKKGNKLQKLLKISKEFVKW